jgi:drug/metabolite transporter (DMT)-like permease
MQKNQVYLILFLVMAIWGLNVIALKVLVATFMPVTMTAFRIFLAGIAVFSTLGAMKRLRLPTKQEWAFLLLVTLFNVILHHLFLSLGLARTTASNGGLIISFVPLLTAVLAILFLGDKASLVRSLGIALGIIGVVFIILAGNSGVGGVSIGDLFVFIAIFVQAISFILIKKRSKTMDPRLMTGYMFIIGAPVLFIISLILEPNGLSSMKNGNFGIFAIFVFSAVVATAMGHMIYNDAIGKIGAAEAAIFINLNPLFALIGAVFLLGETISMAQVIGFIFILLGVLLGSGAFEAQYRYFKKVHKEEGAP